MPYRKEEELKASKASYAEAFQHWVQSHPALWQGKAKIDMIEASKELSRRLLEEAEAEERAEAESGRHEEDSDCVELVQESRTGFRLRSDYGTEDGLRGRMATLNVEQGTVCQDILNTLAHQKRHASKSCECSSPPGQVLHFVSGGAGVGKSRLIETLTEAIETEGGQVVLAAPSGVAAQNISGSTIHSVFRLPVQKSKGVWAYEPLGHQAEKELHSRIGRARLFVLDEVSMVSNTMLEFIHQRLNGIMGVSETEKTLFGGANVLVLGDLLQLPPVKAPHCFAPIPASDYRRMMRGSVGIVQPTHLWARFRYSELTQFMRQ
mgnify:FL=1